MIPVRIELPEWGCVVAVIDDRLYAASMPIGPDLAREPLTPVAFLCGHFLAAVNRALSADFSTDEFDIVSCEGCEPHDHPASHPRSSSAKVISVSEGVYSWGCVLPAGGGETEGLASSTGRPLHAANILRARCTASGSVPYEASTTLLPSAVGPSTQ